jgi:hypothetical protein
MTGILEGVASSAPCTRRSNPACGPFMSCFASFSRRREGSEGKNLPQACQMNFGKKIV